MNKQGRTINHQEVKATVCEENNLTGYSVIVNGEIIGKFVLSGRHYGGAAYSNGYGGDYYMLTAIGPERMVGDGPLYKSIRRATIGLIERAMQAGIIN